MQAGQYLQNFIANFITGQTLPAAPTSLEVALSTADPKADLTGLAEPTGGGYARQSITFGSSSSSNSTGVVVSNSNVITFSNLPASTITHVAVIDNAGNAILYGPLTVARTVATGDNLSFDIGSLTFTIAGNFSIFAGEQIVNWMKGTSPTTTGANLGLSTQDPLRDGSQLQEPNATDNYSKKPLVFSAPVFDSVNQETTTNLTASTVLGPSQTNSWGTLTHSVVVDDSGNMLLYGQLSVPVTNVIGDGFALSVGSVPLAIK